MKNRIIICVLTCCSVMFFSCKSGKDKLTESITQNEQKLFNDSSKVMNTAVAEDILKSYKEYADKYPGDSTAATYLFRAADISIGLKKFNQAIDLYSQFQKQYPDNKKVPVSLFLQAFTYDNNLHDVEKAKMLYSEFIQKYPNHSLIPSAQASLDQLKTGLTNEQLIQQFEAKQDSVSKAGK